MKCPNNELIFRYANGEINEAEEKSVEKHLQECESCRKEYESYTAMRQLMTDHWDGKIEGCFDTETLAEYFGGLVGDSLKKQIEEHLAQCKVCASELELMKQIDVTVEQEVEIPKEVDERILASILAKREEALAGEESLSAFNSIKVNFERTAKGLVERFITRYHTSDRSLVEGFWSMFSSSYNRDAHFGNIPLDAGVSAIAGNSKDAKTAIIIFTIMGICDYLRDFDEIPNRKKLRNIVKQNAERFDVSRSERRRLEEFIIQEFGTDS